MPTTQAPTALTVVIQSVAPADPALGALGCAARAMAGATVEMAVAHVLPDARWGVVTAMAMEVNAVNVQNKS